MAAVENHLTSNAKNQPEMTQLCICVCEDARDKSVLVLDDMMIIINQCACMSYGMICYGSSSYAISNSNFPSPKV